MVIVEIKQRIFRVNRRTLKHFCKCSRFESPTRDIKIKITNSSHRQRQRGKKKLLFFAPSMQSLIHTHQWVSSIMYFNRTSLWKQSNGRTIYKHDKLNNGRTTAMTPPQKNVTMIQWLSNKNQNIYARLVLRWVKIESQVYDCCQQAANFCRTDHRFLYIIYIEVTSPPAYGWGAVYWYRQEEHVNNRGFRIFFYWLH